MSWQVSDGPYYEGMAVEVDKHLKGVMDAIVQRDGQ